MEHIKKHAPNEALWTSADVASYCGVSRYQVFRWAYGGGLPYVRLSERVIRFEPDAVRRWVAAQRESRQ